MIVVHVEAQIDPAKEEQACAEGPRHARGHARRTRLHRLPVLPGHRRPLGRAGPRGLAGPGQPIDAHSASEHMAEFGKTLAQVLAGPVTITQYQAPDSKTFTM